MRSDRSKGIEIIVLRHQLRVVDPVASDRQVAIQIEAFGLNRAEDVTRAGVNNLVHASR